MSVSFGVCVEDGGAARFVGLYRGVESRDDETIHAPGQRLSEVDGQFRFGVGQDTCQIGPIHEIGNVPVRDVAGAPGVRCFDVRRVGVPRGLLNRFDGTNAVPEVCVAGYGGMFPCRAAKLAHVLLEHARDVRVKLFYLPVLDL